MSSSSARKSGGKGGAAAAAASGTARKLSSSSSATAANNNQPKYTAPEPSFLCKFIVFPIYDRIVMFYPQWWTPNGITLFGIFCTLVASLILLSGMPASMPDIVENGGGASAASPFVISEAASKAVLSAGHQFLKDTGFLSVAEDNGVNSLAAEAIGMWFHGMHRRVGGSGGSIASSSRQKGLYGKPIALFPNSITAVFNESRSIIMSSSSSAAAVVAPQQFSRPAHFVDGLSLSIPRAQVIASFVWTNLTASADVFLKHNMDPSTYQTFRENLFDYIQTPIVLALNTVTPIATAGYAYIVDGVLQSVLPDAVMQSQGRLMLIVAGILNLIYCIADNTDGRHARRTKRTSHIGEYLDHGLDCVTSLLSTFFLVTALGAESYYAAWAVLSVALVTVCCHIIHQEQGVMIWGNRFVTVDEAMLAFGLGLMAVGLWYPSYITYTVPVEWIAASLGIPAKFIPASLINTRVVEIGLVLFVLSQLQVFLSIVSRDRSILTRPCSIFMYVNIAALVYFTNTVGSPDSLLSNTLHTLASRAMTAGGFDSAIPTSASSVATAGSAAAAANEFQTAVQQGLASMAALYAPVHVIGFLQTVDAAVNLMFSFEAQWVVVAACTCSIIVHQPIISKCLHRARGVSLKPMVLFLPLVWFSFFFVSSALGAALSIVTHTTQVLWNIRLLENRARTLKGRK